MDLRRLLSYTRKAVDEYQMIQEGDKIAIGVSGGKDSIALALALKSLQRFYPKKFELHAITVTLGFDNFDLSEVKQLFHKYDIPYTVKETDIGNIIFNERKEKNPCSLCAKMRKGALNDAAVELGCNKVALGHHKDDVVETLFLCMFYEGRIYSFSPVTYLDRKKLYSIRPLLYVTEKELITFSNKMQLPVVKSPCPANGNTKREYMKQLLIKLNRENRGLNQRLFTAIQNSYLKGWNMNNIDK